MLKLPVKIVLLGTAAVAVILGSHGLYVYFSMWEFTWEVSDKLFLALEMPARLVPAIEWMSLKGIQSWFIPAIFVVVGIIAGLWGRSIESNMLRKLHLW